MVAAIRASFVNVGFDTVRLLVPDSIIAPESLQALLAVHGAFMSETVNCDPSRGFVAFPVALFDLDLSPGAFRTLAELCRMANKYGQCWPSLAQLGQRLGRSRASISAYIAELREAEVLGTEEQKMANGYNYRLRYTVLFWKEWRASLSQKHKRPRSTQDAQKPERRVQPTERPLRTKNHIHQKQQSQDLSWDLVSRWKAVAAKAPYPAFEQPPSSALVQSTLAIIPAKPEQAPLISVDIKRKLNEFAAGHDVSGDIDALADHMLSTVSSPEALDAVINELERTWEPHWRHLPNAYQIKRLIEGLPPQHNRGTAHKLLKSYMRRWKLYQRSLPSSAISTKVAA